MNLSKTAPQGCYTQLPRESGMRQTQTGHFPDHFRLPSSTRMDLGTPPGTRGDLLAGKAPLAIVRLPQSLIATIPVKLGTHEYNSPAAEHRCKNG